MLLAIIKNEFWKYFDNSALNVSAELSSSKIHGIHWKKGWKFQNFRKLIFISTTQRGNISIFLLSSTPITRIWANRSKLVCWPRVPLVSLTEVWLLMLNLINSISVVLFRLLDHRDLVIDWISLAGSLL